MNSPVDITLETPDTILAIVSLGSNLDSAHGDSCKTLSRAISALSELSARPVITSSLYQTAALDCSPGTPDFINAIALLWLERDCSAMALLGQLQAIETKFGRSRGRVPNQPRSLDLDLICFGNLRCHEPQLVLPHPRAWQRRFVLEPLQEVAPDLPLPDLRLTPRQLLARLQEHQPIRRLDSKELV